ncbi:ninjurin-1-like [Acanthaster planci]|uniref:Ninjurin-1-like n=1 Tax=Acanthaster planci TaxID=133434 RepID=A0A8B7ZQD6_ACAPL|nr:ninjurin-1-like [Acanthaster planci]
MSQSCLPSNFVRQGPDRKAVADPSTFSGSCDDPLRGGRDNTSSSTSNLVDNNAAESHPLTTDTCPTSTSNITLTAPPVHRQSSTGRLARSLQLRTISDEAQSMSMIVHPGSVRRNYEPVHQEMENSTSVPTTPVPSNPAPRAIDYNIYATKKTVSQGLLAVALLMANASQLKSLVSIGHEFRFFRFVTALIIISISLQLVTGVFLLLLGRDNLNDVYRQHRLDRLNNWTTGFVFTIVVINVFIAAFGLQS